MVSEITSKENVHVKHAKKLLSSSKFRKEENCFSIEGIRLCEDAFKSGVNIEKVFYTQNCFEKFGNLISGIIKSVKNSFLVSQNIINIISDTDAPQGIVCICKQSETEIRESNITKSPKIVVLESIQNPSNLGSILRTCDALGVKLIGISENSCDIYNPKTLRGSMGSTFRLNIMFYKDTSEFIKYLQQHSFKVYASVPDDNAIPLGSINFEGKTGIVFGNEGNGLEQKTIDSCNGKMTIPMNKNTESLNVSVAAGIAIWEMTDRGKNING